MVGEVDDENVAEQSDDDREDALNNEDPSPATVARYAFLLSSQSSLDLEVLCWEINHLLEPIREHTRQPVAERANQVEESIALLHVEARVVCRDKINASGKVSCLEQPEQ